MLAAISQVLNECTKPDQASPAAIVLQGLQALCEAEVKSNYLISVLHVLLVDNVTFPSVEFFFFSQIWLHRILLSPHYLTFPVKSFTVLL